MKPHVCHRHRCRHWHFLPSPRYPSSPLAPCSMPGSIFCCLLPALANSLWRRKTAAWHLLRFSVVDFCYFNVLGFSFFPFLYSPLPCFACHCVAFISFSFAFCPNYENVVNESCLGYPSCCVSCSAVRLFWSKWKAFLCLFFFVTPCFSMFFAFRWVFYFWLWLCMCVCLFSIVFCSGLIKFRGFGLRQREQFCFNL